MGERIVGVFRLEARRSKRRFQFSGRAPRQILTLRLDVEHRNCLKWAFPRKATIRIIHGCLKHADYLPLDWHPLSEASRNAIWCQPDRSSDEVRVTKARNLLIVVIEHPTSKQAVERLLTHLAVAGNDNDYRRRGSAASLAVCFRDGQPIRIAVMSGVGIGFFMEADVREDITAGPLVRILDDWPPPLVPLCLYYSNRRNSSASFQDFIALARDFAAGRLAQP